MILNPLSIINDGYAEFYFEKGIKKFGEGLDLFDSVKKGSELLVYNDKTFFLRGKTFKLINKSPTTDGSAGFNE